MGKITRLGGFDFLDSIEPNPMGPVAGSRVLCGACGDASPMDGIKPVYTDAFPGRYGALGGLSTSRNP